MKKILLISLLLNLVSCARNPVDSNYDFVVLSEQQEYDMGRKARETISNSKVYKDEELQKYFNDMAQKIYKVGERPEKDMHFYFLNDDGANAYATPGYIFLNRGLIPFLKDEASLMAVLAHETGHINARHSVKDKSNLFLLNWFFNSISGGAVIPGRSNVTTISMNNYSRKYEYQADELAVKYLQALNVPAGNAMFTHKAFQMYENLQLKMLNLNESLTYKHKKNSEFDSTHPLSKNRARFIEKKSNEWYPLLETYRQKQFYEKIDGMVYGYKGANKKDVLNNLEDFKDLTGPRSSVYGFKNIAYMKKQKYKMVMPEDYQARIMSSDPLGFNYKKMIKVSANTISDDKNIYALDVIADILDIDKSARKDFFKKVKRQKNIFSDKTEKSKEKVQLFSYVQSASLLDLLLGVKTKYYYIYVKQLEDADLEDYFNHFRVIILSTNIKKSFDESMLNDILFIKDNSVELTKKQASLIKPLTIKVKQSKSSTSIEKLSSENIPYIHFNQEWFRIFNGLYDKYNTEVEPGMWLKLIPNPNKNI